MTAQGELLANLDLRQHGFGVLTSRPVVCARACLRASARHENTMEVW